MVQKFVFNLTPIKNSKFFVVANGFNSYLFSKMYNKKNRIVYSVSLSFVLEICTRKFAQRWGRFVNKGVAG
ncbi:hypothetical protein B4U84_01365 [Westiellopsis prolifica IICB1]|nr:hypothetical protein B4U84_01365 [Westiellopsis prolifica IICB1]